MPPMPSSYNSSKSISEAPSPADSSPKTGRSHWYSFLRPSNALRRRVTEVAKLTFRRTMDDRILDLAAQVSFYFVLSLLPFLIVMAAIVGWLPSTTLWQSFAQWLTDYFPYRSRQAVFATILDLTRGYRGFLSFGLLAAIWSASSGFMSLMDALSVACCGKDTRGYWKKRAIATVATLVASLFCLVGFGLWTIGHWATRAFLAEYRYTDTFHFHWNLLAFWLATLVLMFGALALVNHFLPDGKRSWRWFTPGSIFAVAAIVIASVGFNLFLLYSPTVPQVYTVLTGFVLLMTWIYIANLIVLIGAELDTSVKDLYPAK
ncbi:MAG TPA: YihY/virulence factor BrkB family protein [Candidatus Acidoferrum sp.]|jgi:membrane protein